MPRSTPEQRALARQLRAKGHSLGMISYRVGFATTTILRWLDPEKAARYGAQSLQYRRENRTRLNEYSRAYARSHHKGTCPVCGRPTLQMGVKSCKPCLDADRDFVWREIETLWADGLSVKEIAAEMRRSAESVQGHLARMRKAGRHVPPRRRARILQPA